MGKWTRRTFIGAGVVTGLATTGALVVGIAIRPGHRTPELAKFVTDEGESLLTAWVKISQDNTITAIVPHAEMGQGIHTALGMMLAEEMDADWNSVTVEMAPAIPEFANFVLAREYLLGDTKIPGLVQDTVNGGFLKIAQSMGLQVTGGSTSVRWTGVHGVQVAGAASREILMRAAGESWGVSPTTLRTENSMIYHDPSERSAPYAEFAEAAANIKPPLQPKMKARSDYRIIGTSVPRLDLAEKVDGSAMFGIDATLPGMKYAAVKAAPVLGNTVKSMDASDAMQMRGIVDVLNMGEFVAVIADGYWQAKNALGRVNIEFTTSTASTVSHEDLYAQFRRDMDSATRNDTETEDYKLGDSKSALAAAESIVEAEYQVPYLAHATMEPMNATAWVHDGVCEIWAGMQNPLGARNKAASTIGFEPENVIVHNQFLGGGFGRRARPDYTDQAARIAQRLSSPVKIIWSREEDIAQDFYRPAVVSRFRAGVDETRMPVAWENQFVDKHEPVEATHIPYAIANQYIHYTQSPTHMRFGPWRSVDHSQHGFFTESFIDELAYTAGKDGYTFRRELLKGKPRHLAVLDAAAKLGNWGRELPAGMGQGISIVESFGTIVAQLVEVDMSSGMPIAKNVACAADAGLAVNPDSFRAQMESGIIFGLTAALYGDITLTNGQVDQTNFHNYPMIRMDTAPNIDVEIIESNAEVGGAGEPGTPPIAPAFTNAIFAATGKRIRTLPVMNTQFDLAN